MPETWSYPAPGAAAIKMLGGELVVVRQDGLLAARWTGPGLVLNTGLAHIGRFALRPHAVGALSDEAVAEILAAKWVGDHRPWAETPETAAFELDLHGRATVLEDGGLNIEVFGAACWVAPDAARVHLKAAYPAYFAPYADEPAPPLVIAETDTI